MVDLDETRGPEAHADGDRAQLDIDPRLLVQVIGAAGDHDRPLLRRLLLDLHPADAAQMLAELPAAAFETVIAYLGGEFDGEVFAELPDDLRERALNLMPAETVARAIEDLDTDDAAALVEDLAEAKRESVLARASEETRLAVEQNLAADEDTAGRLMQREIVWAPEFWTVGDAIDDMRRAGEGLPDLFFEIYVVDPAMRPIGVIPLSRILRSRREVALTEIADEPRVVIRPETDQEEVAFLFSKYSLISAPVVDGAGRLSGMITVDDMVHVIKEEAKEDLLALAGVSEAQQTDTVLRSVRARAPWLGVNLATAVTASVFISLFERSIEAIVALAILMPIVASLGGNAGTQTLAVAVRALAARELTPANAARIVVREAATGAFNGAIFAVALAAIAGLWFHNQLISLTIAIAVLVNFTMAGLAGILVPLTLKRVGADPAVSSSVFVTFVTDLVGFSVFLGLATWILL
jgi:magnesium transporter